MAEPRLQRHERRGRGVAKVEGPALVAGQPRLASLRERPAGGGDVPAPRGVRLDQAGRRQAGEDAAEKLTPDVQAPFQLGRRRGGRE